MKTLTRGGQVTMHNVNMLRQVMTITMILTALAGLLFWSGKTWFSYTPYERYALMSYYWADMKLSLSGNKDTVTQTYRHPNSREYSVRSLDIKQNPSLQIRAKGFENRMKDDAWMTLWFMVGFFILICGGWFWRGFLQKQTKLLSGLTVVHWKNMKGKLRKFGKHDVKLGRLPFPRAFENEHMLLIGRTGSGKTNAINQLLRQTRCLEKKTVIIDSTGGYVARFYNSKTDKILNPFDERSQSWNLWTECGEDYDFMEFAESLIPPEKRGDSFWVKAAQQMLATAAQNLKDQNKMTIEELLSVLLQKPLSQAVQEFKNTNVATYFEPEAGRMAHSIRAVLIAALWSLKYLETSEHYFSIRQWMQDPHQTGWLFICCDPTQRNVLRPLMTGWLSIAIKSLMAMREDLSRRVWFIMDELASLNYVPCLTDALQEIRKYGGSLVVGMQNYSQVRKIYGYEDCDTIFDLAGTKVGLQSFGHSAEQLSKSFSKQEMLESIESLSYGEHSYRDGVSLSEQRVVRPVVSESDLGMLNPLEAYIKYPRNLPIVKMVFLLERIDSVAEQFIKKTKKAYLDEQARTFADLSQEVYEEKHWKEDLETHRQAKTQKNRDNQLMEIS